MDEEVEKLLSSLYDAVEPESFFEIAIGWYILSFISIIIMSWLIYKSIKWYYSPKRIALKSINKIKKDYENYLDKQNAVVELSITLRRTALAFFPRNEVASLTGERWLQFLNETGETNEFTTKYGKILISGPYTKEINVDIAELINISKKWVSSR